MSEKKILFFSSVLLFFIYLVCFCFIDTRWVYEWRYWEAACIVWVWNELTAFVFLTLSFGDTV